MLVLVINQRISNERASIRMEIIKYCWHSFSWGWRWLPRFSSPYGKLGWALILLMALKTNPWSKTPGNLLAPADEHLKAIQVFPHWSTNRNRLSPENQLSLLLIQSLTIRYDNPIQGEGIKKGFERTSRSIRASLQDVPIIYKRFHQ